MRRPNDPEGVSRRIVDARKANLYSHAHIRIHIQIIIDVVVAVVCLLSFLLSPPSISDHRKTTRSENDRSHAVLSSLFCIELDGVEHCVYVCCSIESDLLAIRRACIRVPSLTLYSLHTLYAFKSLSRESKARKHAEGQTTKE
jgi:hypothetical protein